jgi:hypothetical protein
MKKKSKIFTALLIIIVIPIVMFIFDYRLAIQDKPPSHYL